MGSPIERDIPGDNYIVGGNTAKRNQFPWVASFQVFKSDAWGEDAKWTHACGASIINSRWLLTSRTCIERAQEWAAWRVVVGAHNILSGGDDEPIRQTYEVVEMVGHPTDDIALLNIEEDIQFETRVRPVCLAKMGHQLSPRNLTAMGWGKTSESSQFTDALQWIRLNLVNTNQCIRAYRNLSHVRINPDKHICAGRVGTRGFGLCQGDEGTPLVQINAGGVFSLVGVASSGDECGSPEHPGIYMNVMHFRDWIEEKSGGSAAKNCEKIEKGQKKTGDGN